jgi:hypothetical protein
MRGTLPAILGFAGGGHGSARSLFLLDGCIVDFGTMTRVEAHLVFREQGGAIFLFFAAAFEQPPA